MPQPTTRLITNRSQMRRELEALKPRRIAVAYVGATWREVLGDTDSLEEIIVAPVAGTDPVALEAIAGELGGWDKVHFLDQLHAKFYIGARGLMMGSANLSANAMLNGRTKLYEMVMVTTDKAMRDEAGHQWKTFRELARKAYKSEADKLARIEAMKKAARKVERLRDALPDPKAPTLDRYMIGSETIHLEWWDVESENGCDPDDTNYMNTLLGRKSHYAVGNWVLQWHCDKMGNPKGKSPLEWMHIDEIRRNGAGLRGEKIYIDQLAERLEPTPNMYPFQLDARLQSAFSKLMRTSELRPTNINAEYAPLSPKVVDAFLAELRKQYKTEPA